MSSTLIETNMVSLTRPTEGRDLFLPPLQSDETESRESLPQSIFPCLDSKPGNKGAWQGTEVPFAETTLLHMFCKDNQVSSSSVFQAAWALVLQCYLGRTSVCFACDDSNFASGRKGRIDPDLFHIYQVDSGNKTSLIDVLRGSSIRKNPFPIQRSTPLSSHQDPSSSLNRLPLNTSLVYRELGLQDWPGLGKAAIEDFADEYWKNCEIAIYIGHSANNLVVCVYYVESILSVVSASSVASVYAKAVNEILTNPHRSMGDIDLFTQRDLVRIHDWNASFPHKVNSCVHDLILQHAQDSPQSPALCSWDGDLTYCQLDALSLRLAKYLLSAGIHHGTLVPICFKKSIYAVIAMVAILRAGGAFVPLDPSHPQDRLKEIVRKTNANIIIGSADTADLFQDPTKTVIEVSCSMIESLKSVLESPIPIVDTSNAAFVLFTSGSTGQPKGIIQEHASVSTSSLAHGAFLGITSSSRVFQYAAYTFDVSMMDIFTTLICGGCVCIPSEEDRMGSFTTVMNQMQVNWVLFTPSVASLISPEDVPTLQSLVFGGEAVKQENISRWVGRVRLFNCYGPAECGACAISEISEDSRPGNIGRQFGAELCWVVDPENHNHLQPIGAVGELVVEGPTLARGYLDDFERTQAVFIKSPAWPRGAGPNGPRRVYKTGDLVRQNSDGTYDFAGRKDLQLKVRGQRVELEEVEYHLSTFPCIALSMVAMPRSGIYAHKLVGIIQLQQINHTQTECIKMEVIADEQLVAVDFEKDKLHAFLKSKLPPYMVPTHILTVNRLPLSVSGKIDRKTAGTWLVTSACTLTTELTRNDNKEDRLRPGEVTASKLCSKILSMIAQKGSTPLSTLGGLNFSLHAVGLDSIQVISLSMFIRHNFGVQVYLETLTNPNSTVRSVAATIDKLLVDGSDIMIEPIIDILDTYCKNRQDIIDGFSSAAAGQQNLFLTGATGFLGSRILHQLCGRTNVGKVIVLVRSQTVELALQRIVTSAKQAGWWKDQYLRKLEVWVGDLAKPRLGLKNDQWRHLCGKGPPTESVTAVIHNGATVNWNASLSSLKATNFGSTVELLKAASQSAAMSSFVYVSGGQQLRVGEDDEIDISAEVSRSNGYAQTKFLSELVVKDYAREFAPSQQRVSVVKPGYIIGSVQDGIAMSDDFIWRLTASCIDINGYNVDDSNSWLYVSDVDNVAITVVDGCFNTDATASKSADVLKIFDGILLANFWSILRQELGYDIHPLSSSLWIERIRHAVERKGEKHPLFPLLRVIEHGNGKFGSTCDPRGTVAIDELRIRAAVKRSAEYLRGVGFLPSPSACSEQFFQRTEAAAGPVGICS